MARIDLQARVIAKVLDAPLVIVVPVYNEAEAIPKVVQEWSAMLDSLGISYQFLLLNDGSRDSTLDVLHEMEIRDPQRIVVVDKPNAGHGRTCRLGYSAAAESPAVEWVLQIDSDGQCDPAYFPGFWNKRETADCVFGRRVRRDDGFARVMTSKVCKLGTSLIGGRNIEDPNVPYRLMRREVLAAALQKIPASFDIHNVALTYVMKRTPEVRWAYVPIAFRDRQGGSNSINLFNVAHYGINMLLELRKLK